MNEVAVWPEQVFWVGEEGPKLERFQSPAHVTPADESARIAAALTRGAAGGSPRRRHTADSIAATPVSTPMAAYAQAPISVTTAAPQVTVLVTLDGRKIAASTDVRIGQALGELADLIHNTGGGELASAESRRGR